MEYFKSSDVCTAREAALADGVSPMLVATRWEYSAGMYELVMYRRTLKPRGSLEAGSRIPGSRITFGIRGTRKEIETLRSKHVEKSFPRLGWCQSFEVEEVRT